MANRDVAIRFELLYGDDATAASETEPQRTLKLSTGDQLVIHAERAGMPLAHWAKACAEIDLDAMHGEQRDRPRAQVKPDRSSGRLSKDSTLNQVYGTLAAWNLPPYMAPGLHLYLTRGIASGDFLNSMLRGSFVMALHFADDANRGSFVWWIEMLVSAMPRDAWGSDQKFDDWCDDRLAEAKERDNA